ncbi:MAG: hypothetical protein KDB48_07980, partial [Solirubrobacterales bacterium]|nr:hypothetical protein [Solirubrobacterales bacterium]
MVQTHQTKIPVVFAVLFGVLLLSACLAPRGESAILKPPPGKVFFGVTDTGKASDFRDFARAVG